MSKLKGLIISKYDDMMGSYVCERLIEEAKKQDIKLDCFGIYDNFLVKDSDLISAPVDFVINRYKYVIDSDGLWVDDGYREVHNDTKITCAKWIHDNIHIGTNAMPIKSTYEYVLNDTTFIFRLNDETNEQSCTFTINLI